MEVEDTSLLCSEVTIRKNFQESQKEYPIISSSHSEISLNDFRLNDIISIRTLVDSLSESTISAQNCAFNSICIPVGENTFIGSGELEKSEMKNVVFSNITLELHESSSEAVTNRHTATAECLMNSVSVSRSEDTFYGVICAGITDKTGGSFTCTNSTFVECERNDNTSHSMSNAVPSCTSTTLSSSTRCQYSDLSFRYTSDSHTFINVNFKDCSSTDDGGVIYAKGDTIQLTVSG